MPLLYFLVFTVIDINELPRTVGIIQPLIILVLIPLSRLFIKFLLKKTILFQNKQSIQISLIYGIGRAGRDLSSSILTSTNLKVIGFIDDQKNFLEEK